MIMVQNIHSIVFINFSSIAIYFFANDIFMAWVGVNLNPWSASLAAIACISISNSTNAMSWRPGTRRTSLNPANL